MKTEMKKISFNNKTPWAGLGMDCKDAKNLNQVLNIADLNFNVRKLPVYVDGQTVDGYCATIREDTRELLGIVGKRYEIIQNKDAFSFIDNMVDEGMSFLSAGSTSGSKKTWIVGKLKDRSILGDNISPCIYFENSWDGTGSIRLSVLTLRQVCSNGMCVGTPAHNFSWSIRHTNSAKMKLEVAHNNIQSIEEYMDSYEEYMETLSQKKIEFSDLIHYLLPEPDETNTRAVANYIAKKEGLEFLYDSKEDIQPFKGNAYGAYLALTDYVSHAEPLRMTQKGDENRFLKLTKGNDMIKKAMNYFDRI